MEPSFAGELKMSREPTKISPDEITRLMERTRGRIEIGKISIRDAEYSVHPSTDRSSSQEKAVFNAAKVNFVALKGEQKAGTLVSFKSSFMSKEGDSADLVKVLGSFEVQYAVAEELFDDEEALEAFARINGVFLSWSYWREFFMNACSRMGIHAEMIPLLPAKDAQRIAGYDVGEST